MRFGIFYEHQLPRPWADGSEEQLLRDALEQVELADKVGFSHVWEVEHHFLEEYSHSSAPEVFLAAASQRTTQIRLGHGIILTSPLYNHPARTAERVATLDLISGGRVDFGTGESATSLEMGGFGVDPTLKREQWREGLEVAVRCMTEEPFRGWEGTWVSMPPRNVVPKPKQKPHPPLWVACSRRDTMLMAAEHGMGSLTFAFIDPEEAETWVGGYREALRERCVPIGQAVNGEVACVTPMMVHRDEREAIRRGLEGGNFFGYSLAYYVAFADHLPGTTDVWQHFQERRRDVGYDPEAALTARHAELKAKVEAGDVAGLRGAIGTPEQLRQYLRRYEEAGVDQIIFVLQAGNNRHEHICESLELFGREVLPEFAERDEAHRRRRAAEMEPIVEAAMARKAEVPEPPRPYTPDYKVPAIAKQVLQAVGGDDLLRRIEEGVARGEAVLSEDPKIIEAFRNANA